MKAISFLCKLNYWSAKKRHEKFQIKFSRYLCTECFVTYLKKINNWAKTRIQQNFILFSFTPLK